MEAARDIAGLIQALRYVQRDFPEDSGDDARAHLAGLGIDILPGAAVTFVDLTRDTPSVDRTADRRAEAAAALGRLNDPEGNRALGEALRDEHASVRRAAASALINAFGKPMRAILDGFNEKAGFARADAIAQAQRLIDR